MLQTRQMQAPGSGETKLLPSAPRNAATFKMWWLIGAGKKHSLICPRIRNFDGSVPLLHEQLLWS